MDKTKEFIWLADNELRINLNKLASDGINVWLEDEKLKFKGEQGKVTEEALKWMRQNKTAIISYLLEKEEVQDKGFDLTPIQKAYFLGRDNLYELGGISANYYFEIDMDKLDVKKFESIFNQVIHDNEALRGIILKCGRQAVLSNVPWFSIEVKRVNDEAEQKALRLEWESKIYPLESWPMFHVGLTTKDNCCYRLHVGFDCILLDAWSVTLMLKQIYKLYENDKIMVPAYTFREYCNEHGKLLNEKIQEQAERYWSQRCEMLPKAQALSYAKKLSDITIPHFRRLNYELPRSDTETIYMKAKEYKVTPAAVLCTVYMKVLAEYAESPEFSINLTVFNRLSANREVQEVLGDFTNISIAVYEAKKGRSFKEEVLETQKEFWNLVKYRGYEGVKIIRKMPKNNPVQASLPVVFTGILQGLKQSDYYLPNWAREIYAYSQTPQVSLDYQATDFKGNLSVNWDYVVQAFENFVIQEMFDKNIALLRKIIQLDWEQEIEI